MTAPRDTLTICGENRLRQLLEIEKAACSNNKVQAFYDSEKNARIEWFWDAGFYVTLGDDVNGWKTDRENFETFAEVADYLYNTLEPKKL